MENPPIVYGFDCFDRALGLCYTHNCRIMVARLSSSVIECAQRFSWGGCVALAPRSHGWGAIE